MKPKSIPEVVFSIGHSTRSIEEFIALLQAHGVRQLIDIRTAPGSRKYPQFNSDALARSLRAAGIAYEHMPGLGGFRKAAPDSPNTGWKNASFRGYADYMQTEEFEGFLDEFIRAAAGKPTAMMCSEAVPWRCHRSLVADALTVRGIPVEHIMSPTRRDRHELKSFARVHGTRIEYPPEEDSTSLFDKD